MARRRLPVYELQIGMHVVKLDVPWFRSPFLRHSFLIEQISQIERLIRAGIQTVEIDLDRSLLSNPEEDAPVDLPDGERQSEQVQVVPPPSMKPLAQLNEEHAQAVVAKKQLDEAVHSLYTSITQTGTVHPEQAAEAVQEITIVARTLPNSALFMALTQNRIGDASLSRHALATCTLALMLGQSFQLNPLELQELAMAALLHDIGLLQIPSAIIRRAHITSPPLSELERRKFHAHPQLSVSVLERQRGFDTAVLHLIGHHHPDCTANNTFTPSLSQSMLNRTAILVLVDKYDELLTGFGGATPFGPQQAIQRLYIDTHQFRFSQHIMAQFISLVGIYPVHSPVKLNTNETAVVTALNAEKLHQPVVTITHDAEGIEYPEPIVVDLAHQEEQEHPRAIAIVLDDQSTSEAAKIFRAA